MKTKHIVLLVTCVVGISSLTAVKLFRSQERNLNDEALLSLIKGDQKAFEEFIRSGGDVHGILPLIEGKTYTVAQGLAYFERPGFISFLQKEKKPFLKQDSAASHDIMTLTVMKNNPEILNLLIAEKPQLDLAYGKEQRSLLHLASAQCSYKLTSILHEKGKLNWNLRAKDGSTPLTLAAESGCLPMLGYWKEQKADFKKKDGRGKSAMDILKKNKDAAILAFVQSFEQNRMPASAGAVIPNFYRKRKIPKDQVVDYSSMIEPDDRPLDANETAEFSEFSD